jgi:CHAT domain-containing protein/tetratricopeptide (TPR) repeat protein
MYMPTKLSVACFAAFLFFAGDTGGIIRRNSAGDNRPASIPAASARLLVNQAYQQYKAGNLHKAAALYDEAYQTSMREGDLGLAAKSLQNSGSQQFAMLQYRAAMNRYVEARALAERLGDANLRGAISSNIASIYQQMGEYDLAQAEADKAVKSLGGVVNPEIRAGLLGTAASVMARNNRLRDAVALFCSAINEAGREEDLTLLTRIWDHLGEAMRLAGRLDAADEAFTESYRLRCLLKPRELPISYIKLGRLRLNQNRPGEAERLLSLAIETSGRVPTAVPLWSTLYHRGLARRMQSKDTEALGDFRAAREWAVRWRAEVLPADAVRVSADGDLFHNLHHAHLATAAKLYLRTGRTAYREEAFVAAEESRAASLRESIAGLPQRLPVEYWETLARLRAAVNAGGSARDSRQIDAWRLKLVELESQAGMPIPTPVDLAPASRVRSVQHGLGLEDALLSFTLDQAESFLWVVTREAVRLRLLPPGQEISELASRFSEAVRRGDADAARLGEQLYGTLFPGLPPAVRRRRNWKLVPDDALFGLPFSALVVRRDHARPEYLVQAHRLEVLASPLMTAPGAEHPSRIFAGFGDAVYNAADERRRGSSRLPLGGILRKTSAADRGAGLNRLVGSGAEVVSSARLWSGQDAERMVFLGENVNRERLLEALRARPAVLHLATHVVPLPGEPGHLAVALGLGRQGNLDLLSATDISSEIAMLRSDIGTVVLSGCASGTGRVRPGAGLLGLTRAWLIAGARNVVTSFWPVEDEDGTLFLRFYSHLRRPASSDLGETPVEAFRRAQIDMLKSASELSQPRYWAAYFMLSRGLPE